MLLKVLQVLLVLLCRGLAFVMKGRFQLFWKAELLIRTKLTFCGKWKASNLKDEKSRNWRLIKWLEVLKLQNWVNSTKNRNVWVKIGVNRLKRERFGRKSKG